MQSSPQQPFWHYTMQEAFSRTKSSENGITEQEAADRKKIFGPNTLKEKINTTGLVLFLRQFKTPVTLLLIGAAILSMILGDTVDSYIIFTIIIVSSLLGFWQEKGAADSVSQLYKMIQVKCTVLRDKQTKEIPVADVVPGDIILLSAGALIPADSLLVSSKELFVDEAAFTGETYPAEKDPAVLPEDTPLNKRGNSVFMGCHVLSGKGTALVIQTGHHTEFGKISASLRAKIPETEFERGIGQFGYLLMRITLMLVFLIFAVNVYLHKPVLDSFLFSLALAVGLTPQLLPVIISVNLATGAKRMARKKVIVKKLSSIPNFGSMNILCSDKTGTLTAGKVTVKETICCDGNHSEKVLRYGWMNASQQQGFSNPIDDALCNIYKGPKDECHLQSEVPYDFIRKRLTVQVIDKGENIAITKGALQQVLNICSDAEMADGSIVPIEEKKQSLLQIFEKNCSQGYRILGLAYKKVTDGQDFSKEKETGMTFIGFISLFDPPKKEIFATINELKQLGVSLKVITGDNALVAVNLLKQIGFANPVMLTGAAMRNMSTEAFARQAAMADVFAEVEPNQKEQIILALKKAGHVVGFMGDGINDAPALHVADVGISVDTAVDVAKEAADIILLETDLNVLTHGIREGRLTFSNTMKYVFMATSANFGNMFSMAGASVFLSFLPLLPKQILLTNLLTDLPEMTIATDKVDEVNILRPRRWDIAFIKKFMIVFGLLSSIFDYCTFAVLLMILKADEKTFQTGWFVESVISASLIVLVMRTRLPFFKSVPGKALLITTLSTIAGVLLIPFTKLGALMGFVALPLYSYGWIAGIIAFYVVSAEVTKKWFYKKYDSVK
ncbi:MAG: magnesium-translocating P-type ATPase [Bacteroidota bacterium]